MCSFCPEQAVILKTRRHNSMWTHRFDSVIHSRTTNPNPDLLTSVTRWFRSFMTCADILCFWTNGVTNLLWMLLSRSRDIRQTQCMYVLLKGRTNKLWHMWSVTGLQISCWQTTPSAYKQQIAIRATNGIFTWKFKSLSIICFTAHLKGRLSVNNDQFVTQSCRTKSKGKKSYRRL